VIGKSICWIFVLLSVSNPSTVPATISGAQAACLAGKHKAVKKLLEAGASWRIGEKDGYTCMHGAGFQGE
jgi:hypothetical protein